MRFAPAAALVVLVAWASPALTRSDPAPTGEATAPVSGITVTDVRYELGSGDRIAAITFGISGRPPAQVRARLSPVAVFADCAADPGGRWRCPLADTRLRQAEALTVLASA